MIIIAVQAKGEVVATAEAVVAVVVTEEVAEAATAGAVAAEVADNASKNKNSTITFSNSNTCYSLRDQNTGKRRKAGFAKWPSVVLPLLLVLLP